MQKGISDLFFECVRTAAEPVLGAGHPCLDALDLAIADPSLERVRQAQDALGALDRESSDAILAGARLLLRARPF